MPSVLVHSDLTDKNIRIRHRESSSELLVFDWEMAGWGVSNTDLVFVDVHTYCKHAMYGHYDLGADIVERGQVVSRLFRYVAAVDWKAGNIHPRSSWVSKPMSTIEVYRARLTDAVEQLGWL